MAMMTAVEKILAKAAQLEAQAAALRLAVSVLNGELHEKKQSSAAVTLDQAISLHRAYKKGQRPAELPEKAPPMGRTSAHQQDVARRAAKRDAVVAIVREYGKPMPIKVLAAAARAKGIMSLTGIGGYAEAGLLKQRGSRGKTTYSLP